MSNFLQIMSDIFEERVIEKAEKKAFEEAEKRFPEGKFTKRRVRYSHYKIIARTGFHNVILVHFSVVPEGSTHLLVQDYTDSVTITVTLHFDLKEEFKDLFSNQPGESPC